MTTTTSTIVSDYTAAIHMVEMLYRYKICNRGTYMMKNVYGYDEVNVAVAVVANIF